MGLRLEAVFDQDCQTRIEFAGREDEGGKPFLSYFFNSPADGCFATIVTGKPRKRYNPAVRGRILVDAAKGNVFRYEDESSGFPESFGIDRYTAGESWGYTTIGGSSYLVPVSADFVTRGSNGSMRRVTVEYKNHRHFEASTSVTFGEGK